MRPPSRPAATLVDLVALALLASGPVMILRSRAGMTELRTELERQHIDFPAETAGLPPTLIRFAGRRVRTGTDAHAYSELIKSHLDDATQGRSYAQITTEISAERANGGTQDEKLAALRQTAFMGESLRSGLLGAYQASNIIRLAAGLGALCAGIGASLLVLAHNGPDHHA
jgi:hypothetical protein